METRAKKWREMMYAEKITHLRGVAGVEMQYGTVQGLNGDLYILQSQDGVYTASRAFSCVVKPEAGDKVMYSIDNKQRCYILAIVERPVSDDATLSFKGNVMLNSEHGNVSVAAKDNIDLLSAGRLGMYVDDMELYAKKGVICVENATAVSEQFDGNIKRVRLFSYSIETVAERLMQRLKDSVRIIERMDQTKAGELITTVKNLFSMRSRQAAILARKDVKIDGERIHMG